MKSVKLLLALSIYKYSSIVKKSPVLNATLKKLESILVSASPCVCVLPFIRDFVLKLHKWIFNGKEADAYFFLIISPCNLTTF